MNIICVHWIWVCAAGVGKPFHHSTIIPSNVCYLLRFFRFHRECLSVGCNALLSRNLFKLNFECRRIVCVCSFNLRNESRKWILVSGAAAHKRKMSEKSDHWTKSSSWSLPNVWRRKWISVWVHPMAGRAQPRARREKPIRCNSVKQSNRKMKNKLFSAAVAAVNLINKFLGMRNGPQGGTSEKFSLLRLVWIKIKFYFINDE